MPYLQIRGVEHYYEWIKTPLIDSSQAKPVLIFVHGWAGSARYWESTAQALSDRFDCLLYDMRGFGRSAKLPQTPLELTYELEEYAEDLATLLDSFGLRQVYLNAHSMGASVATYFLNRYPDRIHKAILTCSGIFEYDEKSFSTFHKFGGYVVKFRPQWLGNIPLMHKFFMARFLHRPIPTAMSQAFLGDFLLANYEAALGTIFTSVSKTAAEVMPGEFAKLSVPVLLISGEYDQIIPAQMGKQAAQLCDRIEYTIIPNTGHFPMLEDPETYLTRIKAFLIDTPQP